MKVKNHELSAMSDPFGIQFDPKKGQRHGPPTDAGGLPSRAAALAPPVLCIVGFSGSGKTTVMVGLVAELARRGLRVGTIKHDAHGFDMDHPGKDSWRHKQAGALAAVVSSPRRIGMVMDVDHDHDPLELAALMPDMDIVLAEGFKRAALPKIEVFRPENGKPPACRGQAHLLAVVSRADLDWGVTRFSPDDFEHLAEFVMARFQLPGQKSIAPDTPIR
jgi:molybdopterin-guanine dinucleotide biosynthesis protein B